MLNLESILEEWEKDNQIDQNHLDQSSVDTAKLHSKYLKLLSVCKLQVKRHEMSQKTLLKEKWLYYNGKMTSEEIEEKGWDYDPFNGLKVMKGEMDHYYNSDIDIQKSEEKITYYKTMVETLQEIIETLRWRHQLISNVIKWKQFESGG
jgi:c-di-GMP-related signal transduction protein